MICYGVIDTNVLVSALLSDKADAATVQVINRVLAGIITPVYSSEIMNEYKIVLHREKFGFTKETVDYLLLAIEKFGIRVNPSLSDISLPDPKDVPFYVVVLEKQNDHAYLVTGNTKHFPKKNFVVTPRQLIDILNEKSN
ncbi:MAG: putative toxin-antitoxin system toxin component, PIN family [Acidaminococcaceae bacterium]|nr:putative toxin-antitoxin system toxin component, PIN family [Acidaminococcaceae bacterium]